MIDQYFKPNVKRGAIYDAVIGVVLGILTLIPVLGCLLSPLTCVIGLLLPFAIGWLVAQWGRTMSMTATPLSISSGSPYATPAVDGAVAAGAGHLVSGLIVLVLNLLFSGLFASLGAAGSPGDAGSAAAGIAVGGAAGIFGVIVTTIVAAVAGAIGGVLYVVFSQRQSPAM